MTRLCVKPRINKLNNQININLKRKDIPKELRDKIDKVEKMFFDIKGWE